MSWKAVIDDRRTQRLTFHRLYDEHGKLVSTHQRFGELLEFAIARDIRRLEVKGQDGHWLLDFEPFPW